MTGGLTIHEASMALVTDLGRVRGPQFGLPVNGALDQYSARVANILVGNAEHAPLVELTLFDLAFTPDRDVLVAATGAEMTLEVGGEPRPQWEPVPVRAGERVALRGMVAGMRCYLAIRGSVEVPHLLGSCAPDTVVGFGHSLSAGERLELAGPDDAPMSPYLGISLYNLGVCPPSLDGTAVVDVVDGPEIGEFGGTAHRLFRQPYEVSPRSNHIGLRLGGAEVPVRTSTDEKISRGVPVGAVEVPPGDELLVLHRGRGVTAGYPVLGVVTSTSLDTLGQLRPGQSAVFRHVDAMQARSDVRAWRKALDALRTNVTTVFSSLGFGDGATPNQRGYHHELTSLRAGD
ncbi:biotin-dependent carboxyltransferase family protein [Rothia sp. AR01]|uniref:Biotin-dependent carboxyltransferase family protein n=1 Tax=Rothia santali TaxID=2949643 RepID=A0A9X2HLV2_9MICC|nr:biotin-dependent carboxyltransferase family protein [Rothia santali]MCP3426688.1 biotin-dependent carboxyltransferase family protein [Rothia santali]